MLRTRLPPVIAMFASWGLVMIRSVLKRPCDLISSSVAETWFSNSAVINEPQITRISRIGKAIREGKIQLATDEHGFSQIARERFLFSYLCLICVNPWPKIFKNRLAKSCE